MKRIRKKGKEKEEERRCFVLKVLLDGEEEKTILHRWSSDFYTILNDKPVNDHE